MNNGDLDFIVNSHRNVMITSAAMNLSRWRVWHMSEEYHFVHGTMFEFYDQAKRILKRHRLPFSLS